MNRKYFKRKYDPKTGLEVYNFEVAKGTKQSDPMVVETSDDWTILINSMGEYGASYREYSPANEFVMCQKIFDSKGKLREKTYTVQGGLKVGVWEYYDEDGNITKTVDHDEVFRSFNIKLKDVFSILEKEGWINLDTGEGGREITIKERHASVKYLFNMNISQDENNNYYWYVVFLKDQPNFINYKIDVNTGVFTKYPSSVWFDE